MNASGLLAALALATLLSAVGMSAESDGRVYELRTYWAVPGRLDDLHARFRNHTVKLFERHGMTNVGYWTPINNPDDKLIYLLSHPSREAAKASWKAFGADPEWKNVKAKSEAKGPIVAKIESVFLTPTDYSPQPKPDSAGGRIFEMRTYLATPKNRDQLNARFRDHTLKLFEKHGMTNVAYFVPLAGEKSADDMLVYFLAHKSPEAAKKSFDDFRADPNWQSALKNSEQKAGGPLTLPKGGVKSTLLNATDYSPMR